MRCPLLPYAPFDADDVEYEDEDSPTGTLVSDLQRRLLELGARDIDGSPPEITGRYDVRTARILAHWIAADSARWPDPTLLEATWGHPMTDCRVWRALGFDCEGVDVVPGVTPMAEAILAAAESGKLSLDCARRPHPAARSSDWLFGSVLAASGLFVALTSGRRRRQSWRGLQRPYFR